MSLNQNITNNKQCYHCGDDCESDLIIFEEKNFCCNGCKSVFDILNQNDLCKYYDLNQYPSQLKIGAIRDQKYSFLDNEDLCKQVIVFKNDSQSHIRLYIPAIHCSSCIYLLEQLHKFDQGIIFHQLEFNKKELYIIIDKSTTIRKIVELLSKLGYSPNIESELKNKTIDRSRWYKLGLAGFGFANVMMISIAEYLAIKNPINIEISTYFNLVCFILATAVLFFSASEFFKSAFHGIKNKSINIDLPVAIALLVTYFRSIYEIYYGLGNGYFDSFTGIVFFMLIGRWLQHKTYNQISFDRNFESFFPLSVNVKQNHIYVPKAISEIEVNDEIEIYNEEIVPVDSILLNGKAMIDYSFVTGESHIVEKQIGETIYAGAKQTLGKIELLSIKKVKNSYLTNLWNNPIFNKKESVKSSKYDNLGTIFTMIVLIIGIATSLFWYFNHQYTTMWNALTTILIVACPCALLLTHDFTKGMLIQRFSKIGFYLKNARVIDKFSNLTHIILDKTGTITNPISSNIKYKGNPLNKDQKRIIASILNQSNHVLSKQIFSLLKVVDTIEIKHFKEISGKGVEAWINDDYYKIGSFNFLNQNINNISENATYVGICINSIMLGYFEIESEIRQSVVNIIPNLIKRYKIVILSGDNNSNQKILKETLGNEVESHFNQSPLDKLVYIENLQKSGAKVLYIGDGLNDAGALKQSDIGIAVSNSNNYFTPSADAIINANSMGNLDALINMTLYIKKIIIVIFSISIIYNIIGLFYALQGKLEPMIAAILMPFSTLTIVILSYYLTGIIFNKKINQINNIKSNIK